MHSPRLQMSQPLLPKVSISPLYHIQVYMFHPEVLLKRSSPGDSPDIVI